MNLRYRGIKLCISFFFLQTWQRVLRKHRVYTVGSNFCIFYHPSLLPDSKLNYPMEHKNISLAYPHCTFPHYQYLSHNMINLSNYFKFLNDFYGNCDTCVWFGYEIERKKLRDSGCVAG